MEELPDFKLGMLFDADTTNQLMELALDRDTSPHALLKVIIGLVYENKHLWEALA